MMLLLLDCKSRHRNSLNGIMHFKALLATLYHLQLNHYKHRMYKHLRVCHTHTVTYLVLINGVKGSVISAETLHKQRHNMQRLSLVNNNCLMKRRPFIWPKIYMALLVERNTGLGISCLRWPMCETPPSTVCCSIHCLCLYIRYKWRGDEGNVT